MKSPAVSVVMSVYNGEKDLPSAIDCIYKQTFQDYEYVIVNDGSTDKSPEMLDEYARRDPRIRIIHQKNTGLGPALHRGCTEARGEFIARQDADDISEPSRLAHQHQFISRQRDMVMCGTWSLYTHIEYGPQFKLCTPNSHSFLSRMLIEGRNPFVHGSTMYRREIYNKTGYRFRAFCEEYDLWLQFLTFGKLGILESVEYRYLLTPGSMSFQFRHVNSSLLKLAQELFHEREKFGVERTDWKAAQEQILNCPLPKLPPEERKTADLYLHGIRCLKRKRYQEFIDAMERAERGVGEHAKSARKFSRLGVVPSFLRNPLLSLMRMANILKNGALERYIVYEP